MPAPSSSVQPKVDVEFVFFDLGKVLVDFSHDLACQQMATVSGCSADSIREIVFGSNLQADYERGKISTEQFYEIFCAKTGCTANFDELIGAASEIFELNAAVIPLITALTSNATRRGILSNTCSAHWNVINRKFPTLLELLPVHALSFEMLVAKPDDQIYRQAAELAGVRAETILFVDDRIENVTGARNAGWQAEQYESPQQLFQVFREKGFLI